MDKSKNLILQDDMDSETFERCKSSSEESDDNITLDVPSALSLHPVHGASQDSLHINPALDSPQLLYAQHGTLENNFTVRTESDSHPILSGNRNKSTHYLSRNRQREKILLKKFEDEVLNNEVASKSFKSLRNETQEKYLYQIRRYICHCANKGLADFYVDYDLVKELIENEIEKRGQITENTIKSLRSSLNKLYHMNTIVYPTAQPHIILGDNIVQEIMSNYKETTKKKNTQAIVEGSSSSSSTPLTSRSTTLKEPSDASIISGKSGISSSTSTFPSSIESKEQYYPEGEDGGQGQNEFPGSGADRPEVKFRLSTTSKIKLLPEEESLLNKFNQEVLESERTADILSSLTENTFKSYATDMKRFLRFCARQGRTDTFIVENILKKFLTSEVDKSKKSNSKKLRTSLLKLHQLNCQAYNLDYSEGDIVFLINKHVDGSGPTGLANESPFSVEQFNSTNLLDRLDEMLNTTNQLGGITEANKILHKNEFKRYALFCSNNNFNHFHVNGETVVQYLEELTRNDSTINSKNLRRCLKKLSLLHSLNEENFDNYPTSIENIELVEEFIKNFKAATSGITHPISSSTDPSSSGDGTSAGTYSGVSSSISSLGVNVPPLFLSEQSGEGGSANREETVSSLSSEKFNKDAGSREPINVSDTQGQDENLLSASPLSAILQPGATLNCVEGELKEIANKEDNHGDDNENSENEVNQDESNDGNNYHKNYTEIDGTIDSDEEESGSVSDDEVDDSGNKEEDSSDSSIYTSKRQKLESLPPTTDFIPPFVMNSDIRTVIQLVEEWTLIVKRTNKWGLGWIKTHVDHQIYNDRKILIEFIEDILPELDEKNKGKTITEVDEDQVYEIAKVFDQYITRREITLNDLIRKIVNNPVYSKKEFLRIFTRRQATET